jgi:hypothetical protein
MLNDPKAQTIHQAFIKKFGQRIDIDYLNTEEVVNFFLHSSDEYDRQVLQNRLDRYDANQR